MGGRGLGVLGVWYGVWGVGRERDKEGEIEIGEGEGVGCEGAKERERG